MPTAILSDLPSVLPLGLLQRLCSSEEMRAWDANAIENLGKPGLLLMENAANAVVAHARALMREAGLEGPVVVVCGSGNNGGDGYAVARLLKNDGCDVAVVGLGEPRGADAAANMEQWRAMGPTVALEPTAALEPTMALESTIESGADTAGASSLIADAALLVDALFGTGLSRPVQGEAEALISLMNAAPAPLKIAVDVPSGINADTGAVMGVAVVCTHTVTFQVGKVGCHQHPGAAHAGQVLVKDIGIPVAWEPSRPAAYLLEKPFARALLPQRPPAGHKGSFGHLLTVCGSAGMGGAAMLAGLAALKSGAGLVTSGVPRCLRDGFLADAPELMTLAPEQGEALMLGDGHAELYLEASRSRAAVVLGCGMGQAPGTQEFIRELVRRVEAPLLIDADGLNALDAAALTQREHPTIITPHPGELARLSGLDTTQLAEDRVGHARRLAGEWGVILLLKGAGTVVAAPTGEAFINTTGDEGMATAGSGDVLSGIIGGLLAQRMSPLAAALLGVYLHGLARDCRNAEIAAPSFTASDLLEGLNRAFLELAA